MNNNFEFCFYESSFCTKCEDYCPTIEVYHLDSAGDNISDGIHTYCCGNCSDFYYSSDWKTERNEEVTKVIKTFETLRKEKGINKAISIINRNNSWQKSLRDRGLKN